MYRYGLHTGRHVVFELPPSSSCSSDEVSPQRNGRRRSVPATKRQATKCIRDEMAGDEVYPRRNGWRRSVSATKRRRRNGDDETSCSGTSVFCIHTHLAIFYCHDKYNNYLFQEWQMSPLALMSRGYCGSSRSTDGHWKAFTESPSRGSLSWRIWGVLIHLLSHILSMQTWVVVVYLVYCHNNHVCNVYISIKCSATGNFSALLGVTL